MGCYWEVGLLVDPIVADTTAQEKTDPQKFSGNFLLKEYTEGWG